MLGVLALVLLSACKGGAAEDDGASSMASTDESTDGDTDDSTGESESTSTGETTESTESTDTTESTETTESTDTTEDSEDATDGLELEGDPPEPRTYVAVEGGDFTLLADDDAYTDFSPNGDRLQILPLRPENFPPEVDYCTEGSDAALNDLQQWARARLNDEPKTWYYDVTLETVLEEDGESEYALVLNGEIVETLTNPVTEPADDMNDHTVTWTMVAIEAGDVVEVWGKAHSNLVLEEPPGCRDWSPTYAWARGRWKALSLVATPGVGD